MKVEKGYFLHFPLVSAGYTHFLIMKPTVPIWQKEKLQKFWNYKIQGTDFYPCEGLMFWFWYAGENCSILE